MSVNIHILNSSGVFDRYVDDIDKTVKKAFERIQQFIPIEQVDIVISHNPDAVLPETGTGGYCPEGYSIYISFDVHSDRFEDALHNELVKTLAHESHHAMRHRGPGYGKTLGEALVSEGLADHFRLEVGGGDVPAWSQSLSEDDLNVVKKRAHDLLDDVYDHYAWFFGSEEEKLPRWAGYHLGFVIVEKYLQKTEKSASDLYDAPASDFLTSFYKNDLDKYE